VFVEINDRVMIVDFDERAWPVRGLHNAIALGPILHGLPARLTTSAGVVPAAVSTESAATPESAFGFGPRFVHRERTATHLILIELGRGFLRFLVGCHLDERKATRAAGRRIAHHAY
jgi:hypothetical protein